MDGFDLDPEQIAALMRMRLLERGMPEMFRSGGRIGPLYGGASSIQKDGQQISSLSGGAAIPLPEGLGSIRGGASAMSAPGMPSTITPSVGADLDLGPVQVRGQRQYYDGGRTTDTIGIDANVLGAMLSAAQIMPQGGEPMRQFRADVPVGDARISGSMTTGERMPTTYGGGVTVPGLLGGDFVVGGDYTPEYDDGAVYAQYRRRF